MARLEQADYDGIKTKEQISQKVKNAQGTEKIKLTTANNEAAGETFAIAKYDQYYVLRVARSETALSDAGTTVILDGEYKY